MADRKLMAVLESGSEWMSALNDQVKELRSRLQALEQNTVPSGSAKQKPREWWIRPGSETADYYVYKEENDALRNIGYIRVREVIDE